MRLVLIVVACLAAVPAFACSCIRVVTDNDPVLSDGLPTPTAESLKDEVLFVGEAVKVSPIPTGDEVGDAYFVGGSRTTFRVQGHWNEESPVEVTVESGFAGGGCGFFFEAGKRYLVFAGRLENGVLTTSICTRTTLAEKAPDLVDAIVRVLGEPKVPQSSGVRQR